MSFPITIRDDISGREYTVISASSVLHPKDATVMFIGKKYAKQISALLQVSNCIVFLYESIKVPAEAEERHYIIRCANPRKEYGKFLQDYQADTRPPTTYRSLNQSLISEDAHIAQTAVIGPLVFIDRDVEIGEGTVIHSGVRILPGTKIGKHCEIHENAVIGTIGLAYEQDQIIPQLGGVCIHNNVAIGAGSIIARGAIEDTVIENNCKIDAHSFISHNAHLGKGVIILGGVTLAGSVTVGDHAYISGNVIIKNGVIIGENSVVGMGAVVVKSCGPNVTVFGNPATRL